MSLIVLAVCALFAVPILLGLAVLSIELVWAILTWPFRLAYVGARASKNAAQWIARRLSVWVSWL